jgi:hypothetical protein
MYAVTGWSTITLGGLLLLFWAGLGLYRHVKDRRDHWYTTTTPPHAWRPVLRRIDGRHRLGEVPEPFRLTTWA